MINANELRIGNWVYLVDEESEDSPFLRQVTVSNIGDAEFFEPIPLSSEILEKAGFVEGYVEEYVKENYWFRWNPETKDFAIGGSSDDDRQHHVKVEYVHQLQNLIFALIGTELEINLL